MTRGKNRRQGKKAAEALTGERDKNLEGDQTNSPLRKSARRIRSTIKKDKIEATKGQGVRPSIPVVGTPQMGESGPSFEKKGKKQD